jgi:hypothetical protein
MLHVVVGLGGWCSRSLLSAALDGAGVVVPRRVPWARVSRWCLVASWRLFRRHLDCSSYFWVGGGPFGRYSVGVCSWSPRCARGTLVGGDVASLSRSANVSRSPRCGLSGSIIAGRCMMCGRSMMSPLAIGEVVVVHCVPTLIHRVSAMIFLSLSFCFRVPGSSFCLRPSRRRCITPCERHQRIPDDAHPDAHDRGARCAHVVTIHDVLLG